MPSDPFLWHLADFEAKLDAWIDLEHPDEDVRFIVTEWILTRFSDPYQGVRREPGFPNLWFGAVPETVRAGSVVVCSYWLMESERRLRCNGFATSQTAAVNHPMVRTSGNRGDWSRIYSSFRQLRCALQESDSSNRDGDCALTRQL